MTMKKTILSGMRPTGPLHIGHLFGVLNNWVKFQDEYECFYMIADWHAFMSEYKNAGNIKEFSLQCMAEWIAAGIDPEKAAIFIQSDIHEHLELQMILSVITPIPWLERCPTYKEQLKELKDKDIFTHAFLGYPVLQTADIALYKAHSVPVGHDQLPHLELGREIIRRFHHIFNCEIFPEPEPILTESARILGTDRRKMSKSYENTINLADEADDIRKKVMKMITDASRIKLSDPGHPDVCNVFSYYGIFAQGQVNEVKDWCEGAKIGCTECKKRIAESIIEYLKPIKEKRDELLNNKDYLNEILKKGEARARERAEGTLREVKQVVRL